MLPLIIGGAASLVSGIFGHLANASAAERANALQDKALQEWLSVNIPDPADQQLALDRFVQTGELTPHLEHAIKANDTELSNVSVDPKYKQTRLRALQSLEEQGYGGENTLDDAALQKSLIESGAKSRGQQEAITGSLARRGQLGDGLELSARMGAQQAEGDRLASQGLDLETARRQRALQAIMGAGDLAGDMESDEYNRDSSLAKARDSINMFNTQNLQEVGSRNATRATDADRYNLDLKQDIANRNTSVANDEQRYNKSLIQQQFENRAQKAAGMSGQYNSQAKSAIDQGKNAAAMWGGIAKGAGQAGAGINDYNSYDDDPIAPLAPPKPIASSTTSNLDDYYRRKA